MDEEYIGALSKIAADFEELVRLLDGAISTGTFESLCGAKAAAERGLKLAKELPLSSGK